MNLIYAYRNRSQVTFFIKDLIMNLNTLKKMSKAVNNLTCNLLRILFTAPADESINRSEADRKRDYSQAEIDTELAIFRGIHRV